ncbi:hypothetical protein BPOR_1397g00010 [Botrytis porri]|uniref:Uncharacterized protein n=1 Tax=Botrytis porri TaxID=87229 RepID=A0A4Z1K4J5_9HELO|nr:hypothetical protein BPOR_1397g00010 [Botrytis porri]
MPTRQKLPTVITTAQNGPSALARLQDMQNIFYVAFGILDRTFQTITWLFVENWTLMTDREQQAAATSLQLAALRKWRNTTSAFTQVSIRDPQ